MDIHQTVTDKSKLLLDLQILRQEKKRKMYLGIATQAAVLESQIALYYLNKGDQRNAAISLVSEASCLAIAERWRESLRVYSEAIRFSSSTKTVEWIKAEMVKASGQLGRTHWEIPFSAQTSIEGNRKLREPQIRAYKAAKEHFAVSSEHAIIQLPVGCGKTGTMAILPFHMSTGRALVIAPNLEIAINLKKNFDYSEPTNFLKRTAVLGNGHGPSCAVLDASANVLDCDNSDFVVTNIQQLVARNSEKWLDKFSADYFDMLLIDEGHHNVAPSWRNVMDRFPNAKKISFTATPLRSDGQKVDGKRIYRFPIAEAIRDGYIKDISSHRLEPIEISFTYKDQPAKTHTLDEVMKLREENWFSRGVALSPECNRNIADASIRCLQALRERGTAKHQIIAAACSIDHANAISSLYRERGLSADVIHSKMESSKKEEVLESLRAQRLDVIVHVAMLGEGADYPTLSVAAIFRPYRHVVPYIQFVGRIMRVIHDRDPGHPDNHGYVVSHFGLNIDRWWEELKSLDEDDKEFYQDIANGTKEFVINVDDDAVLQGQRRNFSSEMRVIEETISHFILHRFLPEDSHAMVDELMQMMSLRGFDLDALGISREEIERRVLESQQAAEKRGKHEPLPVQPQLARKEARRRLSERVKSGAKRLLDALGYPVTGYQLVQKSGTGAGTNLPAAIILLNRAVLDFLSVGANERDTLSTEQCQKAHDAMDELIDQLVAKYRT